MAELPRLLFSVERLAAMGRCTGCGWHPRHQGHHDECPTAAGSARGPDTDEEG